LMSLGAEFPTPLNTTAINDTIGTANATSVNGSSVVVWSHLDGPISNATFDIRAQRLINGIKVGPEILVSTGPAGVDPASVAIDNQGDFVVAWEQNQPNGNSDILARKFGPAGNALGGIVPVAVGTFAQTGPSVAMDAKGDFVVSYTRNTNNNNPDIFAKLYNVNEQLVNVVSVATTPSIEVQSSVAMTPDGRFDVAYLAANQGGSAIKLNEYSAQGGLLRALTLTPITVPAYHPSVSVDNLGNAVVAWQDYSGSDSSILARSVSYLGGLGPVLTIASSPTLAEQDASVALKRDGSGAFVVAYDSDVPNVIEVKNGKDQVLTNQVLVAEVTPNIGSLPTITTLSAGPVEGSTSPAVSINNSGRYLLTYSKDYVHISGRYGQLPSTRPVSGPPLA
jgi:hypothetical protein